MHQCYYCEQLFDSKEDLYQHVEVHSDIDRNKEIMNRKKTVQKKIILLALINKKLFKSQNF